MTAGQAGLLKEARVRRRMTQEELAGAAGLSARTVMRAENGRSVSADAVKALCAVLGLDAAELPPPSVLDGGATDAVAGVPPTDGVAAALSPAGRARLSLLLLAGVVAAMAGAVSDYVLNVRHADHRWLLPHMNAVVTTAFEGRVAETADKLAAVMDGLPIGKAPVVELRHVDGPVPSQVVVGGPGGDVDLYPMTGIWRWDRSRKDGIGGSSPRWINETWASWQWRRVLEGVLVALAPDTEGGLLNSRVGVFLGGLSKDAVEIVSGPLDKPMCEAAVRGVPLRLSDRARYAVTADETGVVDGEWKQPKGVGAERDVAACGDGGWFHMSVARAAGGGR
jgi:transcriptional regulator with XRE-family HTH domain